MESEQSMYHIPKIPILSLSEIPIPDGLFPKEELAVERWTNLCCQAELLCKEKQIEKIEFYPNQHSKSLSEKTIGIALSNYRQAISGKGTSKHYECVDHIIKNYGFYHWIQFRTDEERSIHKWSERIKNGYRLALLYGIPFDSYYPNQRSDLEEEKELGIALVNYRQALQKKGTHKIYESITEMLKNECPHWIYISVAEKKCLDQWRKRYDYIRRKAIELQIPISIYLSTIPTKDRKEKEISIALEAYNQRAVYPSVNRLVELLKPKIKSQNGSPKLQPSTFPLIT